jgi:hypothetical protein
MSQEELRLMENSGKAQESTGGGGGCWVAQPSDPKAFNAAKAGGLYVEFDVPVGSTTQLGSGWAKIPGPNSIQGRLAANKGQPVPEMPSVRNIVVKETK